MGGQKKKVHRLSIWPMVEKQLVIKQAHAYLGGLEIELCPMQLVV